MVSIIVLTLRTGGLKLNSPRYILAIALLDGIMFVLATPKDGNTSSTAMGCDESLTITTGKNGRSQHGDASKKHFIHIASCGLMSLG